jgi:hypothetical protein
MVIVDSVTGALWVFGGPEIHKAPVTESTITIPQSSYGAQKHICEVFSSPLSGSRTIPEQKLDAAPDGFPGRTMIVGNRTNNHHPAVFIRGAEAYLRGVV